MDLASKTNLENRLTVVLEHHNAIRKGLGKHIYQKDKLIEELLKLAPNILKYSAPVWRKIDQFKSENKKGNEPNKAILTQDKAGNKKAWGRLSFLYY